MILTSERRNVNNKTWNVKIPQCILNRKVKITAKRFSASFSKNILPFCGTGCTVSRKSQFQREKLRTVSQKTIVARTKECFRIFLEKNRQGFWQSGKHCEDGGRIGNGWGDIFTEVEGVSGTGIRYSLIFCQAYPNWSSEPIWIIEALP